MRRRMRFEVLRPLALPLAAALAIAAGWWTLGHAQPKELHRWSPGDALTAEHLNSNFDALETRIAALESSQLAGSHPAVIGLGDASEIGGFYFCGTAPQTLTLSKDVPFASWVPETYEYGQLVFTRGGAVSLALGAPFESTCPTTSNADPTSSQQLCFAPLTFFLKSTVAQTLELRLFLDDIGAVYVDGAKKQSVNDKEGGKTFQIDVPQGPFALSLLSCSNNGASGAVMSYDPFLTDKYKETLQIDWDRVLHRNGK